MIKENVGKRIRELRNAKMLSQEKFATVCGLDRTYIAGVEQGKRNISIENLKKIADALNISLSDMFDFTKPVHKTILLTVNGVKFILESKTELTYDIKEEIELICRYAYDDESHLLEEMDESSTVEDLYEADPYTIAILFSKAVKTALNIDVVFMPIELEVSISEGSIMY